MSAELLKGAAVAQKIQERIEQRVRELETESSIRPGLATILVGANPASESYVRAKQKTARELGFFSVQENLEADVSQQELLALIRRFNEDADIHGILVQLPLPRHLDETQIVNSIDPAKDVDAFHPVNLGKLLAGSPDFIPCTPAGIYELILASGIETKGAEVVVLGRSNIVGKPIANLLMQKNGGNCTVTVCHTGTRDVAFHTRRADILIAAMGVAEFVRGDMVRSESVVIDVGVNEVGQKPDGKRILKGDVCFDEVRRKARAITPVPGGVGPMTIAMLMENTLRACVLRSATER